MLLVPNLGSLWLVIDPLKFVTPFELICVYAVRLRSRFSGLFFFLAHGFPVVLVPFVEKVTFSPSNCFYISVKNLLLFSRKSCPNLCDPMTAAHQASLSFTISWSLCKLMSIELVMPSNHFILCHLLFSSCPQSFPASGSSKIR